MAAWRLCESECVACISCSPFLISRGKLASSVRDIRTWRGVIELFGLIALGPTTLEVKADCVVVIIVVEYPCESLDPTRTIMRSGDGICKTKLSIQTQRNAINVDSHSLQVLPRH